MHSSLPSDQALRPLHPHLPIRALLPRNPLHPLHPRLDTLPRSARPHPPPHNAHIPRTRQAQHLLLDLVAYAGGQMTDPITETAIRGRLLRASFDAQVF